MDLENLHELIRILEQSKLAEIEIEEGGRRIRLRKGPSENAAVPYPIAPYPYVSHPAPTAAAPPSPVGEVACSAPPATITSQVPYWIMRMASAILCEPVLQAETIEIFGPLKPLMMEIWPATMLTMLAGTKNGEILRGPPFR